MVVYHKIVRTKSTIKDVSKQLRQYPGINYLILGQTSGLNEITLEFICSDADPAQTAVPQGISIICSCILMLLKSWIPIETSQQEQVVRQITCYRYLQIRHRTKMIMKRLKR